MLMVIIMLGRVGYARFYAGRFGAGQTSGVLLPEWQLGSGEDATCFCSEAQGAVHSSG